MTKTFHSELVPEERTDSRGRSVTKWIRSEGRKPPSQAPKHRNEYYHKIRRKALLAVGGEVCVRCGYTDFRALQIDHINADGKKDFQKYSGVAYYHQVIRNPDRTKYQVLCANCNVIKKLVNNECGRSFDKDWSLP